MVPSSTDIIIQNRRISQSETRARTIGDVVNTYSLQYVWLDAIKMSLRQYFRLLLDYRDIWISPNERTVVRSDAT